MMRRHTAPLVTKEEFEMEEIRLFWLVLYLLKAGNRPTKRRGVAVGHIKVLHTTI
jgi:hypothetical protein